MKRFIALMLLIVAGLTALAVTTYAQGMTIERRFSVKGAPNVPHGGVMHEVDAVIAAYRDSKLVLPQDLMNVLRSRGWYVERRWGDIWGEEPSLHLTIWIEVNGRRHPELGYVKLSIGINTYPEREDFTVDKLLEQWIERPYSEVKHLSMYHSKEQWYDSMQKRNKFFVDGFREDANEFPTRYGGIPIVNVDYTMYGWYFITSENYGQIILKNGYPYEMDWD